MRKFVALALFAAAIVALLCGCQLYNHDYREEVLEYALISTDGDFSELQQYPNLAYVDLRGSTCYEEILTYSATHPKIEVRYNVLLGEKRFDSSAKSVTLNGYETDFTALYDNLQYLKNLEAVHINQITFSRSDLDQLMEKYPHVAFTYTVELLGRRYDHTVTEMELTHLTPADVDAAAKALSLLPDLTDVKLSVTAATNHLSVTDVRTLVEACPNIRFNYKFDLFSQTISTQDETLVFDSVNIGNDGLNEIRNALDIMPLCTYVKLDSCEIDNELLAQLRADYPEKTIAWRVFAGKFSIMTDEEMLRMPYNLTDAQAEDLKYCNKVKYLDIQEAKITNIDFMTSMPGLECVVLSHTKITDLSPLSGCSNLTWLELYNCKISDLTPLAGLSNLKYLNIAGTRVSDLSVIEKLPIERFNCFKSSVKTNTLDAFEQSHPNCVITSKGYTLDYGWRYEDKAGTQPFPYYAQMIEIFRYNEKGFKGNTK